MVDKLLFSEKMLFSCNVMSFPFLFFSLQPAPPREAHFVRTNGKDPELLEPIPYEFMA